MTERAEEIQRELASRNPGKKPPGRQDHPQAS